MIIFAGILVIMIVYSNLVHNMEIIIKQLQKRLNAIQIGKATTNLLDGVKVDYYGTPTPIAQVGNISTPDYHTITIQPWDKSIMGLIEKAILTSDLGLNPSNDGNVIRVPIPALNEERRKEIVKMVKKFAEESRVAIRNIRRDRIKKGQNKEDVQKDTDSFIEEINEMTDKKEKEIMEL